MSGVGVLDKQDQDRELLVGARRQRPLRRFHAYVAVGFAALEKVEQWSGSDHRVCK